LMGMFYKPTLPMWPSMVSWWPNTWARYDWQDEYTNILHFVKGAILYICLTVNLIDGPSYWWLVGLINCDWMNEMTDWLTDEVTEWKPMRTWLAWKAELISDWLGWCTTWVWSS
jgi:hypothetical protein